MPRLKNRPDSDLILSSAIGLTTAQIFSLGYEVVDCDSIKVLKKLNKQREGRPLTAHGDEQFFDFVSGNSFLLVVQDEQQNIIGTISALSDDIQKSNLAELWSKRMPRCYGGRMGKHFAPSAFEITGKIVYQGELWIAKSHQRNGLGWLLPRLSLLLSLQKFNPDHVYALVGSGMVHAKRLERIGYVGTEMNVFDWDEMPEGYDQKFWDFWLAYSSRQNIQHLAYTIFSQSSQKMRTSQSAQA